MAPAPLPTEPSLERLLLPPLWLLAASALPRTRHTLPLILITLFLALHPLLRIAPLHATPHLTPLIRQVPPPEASPLPAVPPPSPSPAPSPAQSPPPPTAPPPQQQQPFPPFPQNNGDVALDACSGGLKRMQLTLLLELCFEIFFLFLRCCAEEERDYEDATVDVTMRGYVLLRAIYVVPVLAVNAGIYWVGGGETAECLRRFSAVQIPFVHLIFYAMYCVIIVIVGVYRIMEYEKHSSYNSDFYDDSNGPPTRTASYFRSFGRRPPRRDGTSTSSSDYAKFRVNLGCCKLNF